MKWHSLQVSCSLRPQTIIIIIKEYIYTKFRNCRGKPLLQVVVYCACSSGFTVHLAYFRTFSNNCQKLNKKIKNLKLQKILINTMGRSYLRFTTKIGVHLGAMVWPCECPTNTYVSTCKNILLFWLLKREILKQKCSTSIILIDLWNH